MRLARIEFCEAPLRSSNPTVVFPAMTFPAPGASPPMKLLDALELMLMPCVRFPSAAVPKAFVPIRLP